MSGPRPRAGGPRAAVVVIDACGVGALPDAAEYGDEGANTLLHVARAVGGLRLPTLARLGLGSIVALPGVAPAHEPAIHGRLHALGPGKDSAAGHWELMGIVVDHAPPTYPDGLPAPLVERLRAAMGRDVIGNGAYDGFAAIERFGSEHLREGGLILYTSVDSVLQLAAHVDRVSVAELYAACRAARAVMAGEHAVGRVIARPFSGEPGAFRRLPDRHDFALAPPKRGYLNELAEAGLEVHGVGKVSDLFAGSGITATHPGADNAQALASTDALLAGLERGLIFVNLVDTDQVHGHRKDAAGFHDALIEIDRAVAAWLELMGPDDLLILCADHGCDPAQAGTDHTREYAPLLAVVGDPAQAAGRRHEGPLADVGATTLAWLAGRDAPELPGAPFVRR